MKANESYYPVTFDNVAELGISIRNKLAWDMFLNLMNKPRGLLRPDYEDILLNRAFELADLFIKKAQENDKTQ